MNLLEYRIVLPTSLSKLRAAIIFTIEQMSHDPDSMFTGEGAELLANEPYQTETESGRFTHIVMHKKSRMPAFLRLVVPDKYLTFHSKRWDAWPHERSEMTNPGMGAGFMMKMEVQHIPYRPSEPFPDNLLNLDAEQLALRKVIWIDVVDSNPQPDKKEDSLKGFVCPEGGILTPLEGSKQGTAADESKPPMWTESYQGEMVCTVRVVQFQFKWRGLQTIIETNMAAKNRTMGLDIQRTIVRNAAEWYNLTDADVQVIEDRFLAQFATGGVVSDDSVPDEGPDETPDVPEGADEEGSGGDADADGND
jgi:hypothetical protein